MNIDKSVSAGVSRGYLRLAMKPTSLQKIRSVPFTVWFGLLCAIALDTAVQILWKGLIVGVSDSPGLIEGLTRLGVNPRFYCLLALFAMQFFCWMVVLGKADLTYIKPFTSISIVTVALCASVEFNEQIGGIRLAGIIMILAGVWLTSGTDHKTTDSGDAASSGRDGVSWKG